MPSADFCMLTVTVSNDGAIGVHHEITVWFVFPARDSHPSTANARAGALFAGLAHPGFSHDDPIALRADLPG
jgi:hypothetical protein